MRRTLVLAVAALALLGVVTPHAFAQAPAPTFKITGFIDSLMTYGNNTSLLDGDLHRKDSIWYGRNRGRFDIIGEYGKAKAVLGVELDFVYGQTGSNDSTIVNAGAAATTAVTAHFGTDGSFDLNTDTRGIFEIKWMYVETDLPFMPVATSPA
jgi:opacity protein-like surface antigen